MKVYLTDGTSFECGGYKALDSGGVVLTADKKRKQVIGYVPRESLVYVLPDDVAPGDSLAEEDGGDDAGDVSEGDEAEGDEDGDEHETGESGTDDRDDDTDPATAEAEVDPDVAGVTTVADGETEHTHENLAARIDEVEGRVDGLDGRVDAMTEQLATVVSAGGVGAEAERHPEDPRNIRGIGEAYATRLRAAGIDTVSALREASDEELAAAADVSAQRVTDWKRRAERYAEQQAADGDTEPESDADTENETDTDDATGDG
ncbi:helix-hairpin-helix domain-containing protein [Haloferax sp. Q22]|uniref:helix-hairpin-helix domain-containing protein n=1 Tax=Haloferax sp. (strain Q22) TaxID=1526048 RepID=UPI000737C3FF|nr:helix-hairpin-helix domain-containing protein [Haloferax sp. Q22]